MKKISDFFACSDLLDHDALRPLDHIRSNWELSWDWNKNIYREEDNSFAGALNALIVDLESVKPPDDYHKYEDRIAELLKQGLRPNIIKVGARWIGEDYGFILEQGSFDDIGQAYLMYAVVGRVAAAKSRGQLHYDNMETQHRRMLGELIAIILYHRADFVD